MAKREQVIKDNVERKNFVFNPGHFDQIDQETDELFLNDSKLNFFIGEPYKAGLKEALGL